MLKVFTAVQKIWFRVRENISIGLRKFCQKKKKNNRLKSLIISRFFYYFFVMIFWPYLELPKWEVLNIDIHYKMPQVCQILALHEPCQLCTVLGSQFKIIHVQLSWKSCWGCTTNATVYFLVIKVHFQVWMWGICFTCCQNRMKICQLWADSM